MKQTTRLLSCALCLWALAGAEIFAQAAPAKQRNSHHASKVTEEEGGNGNYGNGGNGNSRVTLGSEVTPRDLSCQSLDEKILFSLDAFPDRGLTTAQLTWEEKTISTTCERVPNTTSTDSKQNHTIAQCRGFTKSGLLVDISIEKPSFDDDFTAVLALGNNKKENKDVLICGNTGFGE